MKELAKKALICMKNEGIGQTVLKSKIYIKDHLLYKNQKPQNFNNYVDVLFVNGCALPHPMRYRVLHQAEQLLMANITSNTVFYEDLELNLVNYARLFVFFRCPHTDTVERFIAAAKKYNKTVIFDIDDLVFDTVYTDQVKYVQQMPEAERAIYDDGVKRMGKTLKLCDIATTTTEELAKELSKYVKQVYVNRNVASESMIMYSENALSLSRKIEKEKSKYEEIGIKKVEGQVSLGYFSGSITHNDDFAIILPAVARLMQENPQVHLYLVGELDLPDLLKRYKTRIHSLGFMDWTKLPSVIAQMDINLAPLEDTIFNRAKSENKWTEASLVKVVTVASDVGAFSKMIQDNVTGVLCKNTEEDWYSKLRKVVGDKKTRKSIEQNAYNYTHCNCITMETCYDYAEFIKNNMSPNIMFKIPTAQISGGVLVAQKHASFLQEEGMDVSFINDGGEEITEFTYGKNAFPIIRSRSSAFLGSIDIAVATLYTTMEFVQNYPNIKKRLYLVQGLETSFASPGEWNRVRASQAYIPIGKVGFITISRWCQRWLESKYHVEAHYAPNGIDCKAFFPGARDFTGKIRILVEGNSDDKNKNVDESFRIVEKLDKSKYEIWYISYQGKAKEWYRVDRFFRRVPNGEMPKLYRKCHILLKSSILESFSYPPLEMMATGGLVVARANDGNREYLVHGKNCLFYDPKHLDTAVDNIENIVLDEELRARLISNGIETASLRDWSKIKDDIVKLYD